MMASGPMLGADNVGDLVEIVIVILVVAASAFGAIAKKLIEYFSTAQTEAKAERTRRRSESEFPTARPMAPSGKAPPVTPRRSVRRGVSEEDDGSEEPTIVRRIGPIVVEVRKGGVQVRTEPRPGSERPRPSPAAPARPVAQTPPPAPPLPRPVRQSGPRPAVPPAPRRTGGTGSRSAPASTSAPPAKGALGGLMERMARTTSADQHRVERGQSDIEQRMGRFGAGVEAHLGHVEPMAHPATAAPPTAAPESGSWFDRSSSLTLRQAVVYSELLAPPLGLRDPAETF